MARADVTLGLSTPGFAQMIENSPVLAGRALEMLAQREFALADAIAAETGADDPRQRLAAAMLASVYRVFNAEGSRLSKAGLPRNEICATPGAAAARLFDLLEPSLGGYSFVPRPARVSPP